MFCPFCGSETTTTVGEARRCTRTAAALSAHVSLELIRCFVDRSRRPKESPLGFRVGRRWFCPGCGDEMLVTEHDVHCTRCGRHLNEFIRELVELNPHPGLGPDVAKAER